MVCPKCGKVIEDGSEFCRYCGTVFAEYLPQITRSAPVSSVPTGIGQPVSAQTTGVDIRCAPAAAKKKTRLPLIIGISAAAVVVIAAVIVLRIENVTDMDYDLPYGNKTISGKYTGTIQLGKPQGKGKFSFSDDFTYHNDLFNFDTGYRNDYIYSGEFRDGVLTDTDTVTVDLYNSDSEHLYRFEFEGDFREMKPYDCTFVMSVPEDSVLWFDKLISGDNSALTGKIRQGKVKLDVNDIEIIHNIAEIAKLIPGVSSFADTVLGFANGIVDVVAEDSFFASCGIFEF